MEELQEGFMKEQASFWLTSTLTQFGREVMELARQGLESYGAPVAFHFSTILGTWRQGRDAYEAGDYAQALRLAQATQDSINEIAEMQLLYPYPDKAKELAAHVDRFAVAPCPSGEGERH